MNNIYIKVGYDKRWCLIPLNNVTFEIDNTNCIHTIYDLQGDVWDNVCSFSNNDEFTIKDFKCHSIEELIVTLDVHNCLYRLNMS